MKCLKGSVKVARDRYTLPKVLGWTPILNFYPEQDICAGCGNKLLVEKAKIRTIHTVSMGQVTVKETIKKCKKCQGRYRSTYLPEIVKSGNNYGYDVTVEIGRLRYIEKRQIAEIQDLLCQKHSLTISLTQIRRMAYDFLNYLGRLHYSKSKKINSILSQQGGYVLYVDSTCEGRSPHLLTCIDGISGFVLYSEKITSENTESLTASFRKVKDLYGQPLCSVHDMGPGIIKALDIAFPGIKHVICHFHLLRDIGKDLLQDLYRKVQKILSDKEIYAKIRYQVQALEKTVGGRAFAEAAFLKATEKSTKDRETLQLGLLYGCLLRLKTHETNTGSYGFPFDRPKLDYYKLIISTYNELNQINKNHLYSDKTQIGIRFNCIMKELANIVKNIELKKTVKNLEKHCLYFDQLREVMRIALPETKKGLNDEGDKLSQMALENMEKELKALVKKLEGTIRRCPEDSDERRKLMGVLKQLKKYWDKIFANPIHIQANGEEIVVIPNRTNNISEQFYRKIKQLLRRLHGRPTLTKDIDYLPEELALIENLKNLNYVKSIIGSIEELSTEFAQLDIKNIELPFEKEDSTIQISAKIKNTLKTFSLLELVKKIA